MSLKDVADLLGIRRQTVVEWIKSGDLPRTCYQQPGGRVYLFSKKAIFEWLRSGDQEPRRRSARRPRPPQEPRQADHSSQLDLLGGGQAPPTGAPNPVPLPTTPPATSAPRQATEGGKRRVIPPEEQDQMLREFLEVHGPFDEDWTWPGGAAHGVFVRPNGEEVSCRNLRNWRMKREKAGTHWW